MADFIRLPDVTMVVLRVRDDVHDLPMPGKSIVMGDDRVVAVGPDEWLVIADDGDAEALCVRVGHYGGCILQCSGNRARYRIEGDHARQLLSAGCSFDVDNLKPGDAISTMLARAQVIIIAETKSSFLVLPRRSFASYLEAWSSTIRG